MYSSSLQINFLDSVAELSSAVSPSWPVSVVVSGGSLGYEKLCYAFLHGRKVGKHCLERRHTSDDEEHCPTACQDKRSS
jgi:hypothetical protein